MAFRDRSSFDWCYNNPYGPYAVAERYIHWRRVRNGDDDDCDIGRELPPITNTLKKLLNIIFAYEKRNDRTIDEFVRSLDLYDIWGKWNMARVRFEFTFKEKCAKLCGTDVDFDWKHVVELYAYLGRIAADAAVLNQPYILQKFIDCIATETKLNDKWIASHGGWDRGLEFVKNPQPKSVATRRSL